MLNLGCLERRKKKGAEGAKKAQRGYCPFLGLCRDRAFWLCVVTSVATKLSSSVSRHGPLCRDMVHRLQRVVGSRQGFSWL